MTLEIPNICFAAVYEMIGRAVLKLRSGDTMTIIVGNQSFSVKAETLVSMRKPSSSMFIEARRGEEQLDIKSMIEPP